jgi:hypothetical protein
MLTLLARSGSTSWLSAPVGGLSRRYWRRHALALVPPLCLQCHVLAIPWRPIPLASTERLAASRTSTVSKLGVGDGWNTEILPTDHAKRSRLTKWARGGGRTNADCVTLFEGSSTGEVAHPGFRFAPPGATFRHPLRGFVGIGWSYVHRPPTRSAADPRSGLGVGDGRMQIASPSSRVQVLERLLTPGSASLHPGLRSVTRCAGLLASDGRMSIDRPREAQQTHEVGANRSRPNLLGATMCHCS